MKSIRSNPTGDARRGDERIRTAVCVHGAIRTITREIGWRLASLADGEGCFSISRGAPTTEPARASMWSGTDPRIVTLRRERDEALARLTRLSECVMRGWTSPAFARGRLHEEAVAIAREVLARAEAGT